MTFAQTSGDKIRIRLSKVKVAADEKAFALRESGGEPILAEVPLAAVSALDKSPLELRDKSVLSFNREEVARISVSPGGGAAAIVAEKSSSDAGVGEDWRLTAPEAAPAKKWKLSSVLWSLSSLKATSIGEDNPKDWGKFGISASSRSVTLADKGGKVLAKLELGSEVKGKPGAVYAKGSRGAILEVDASKLTEVPWKAADLIEQPAGADGGNPGVSSN